MRRLLFRSRHTALLAGVACAQPEDVRTRTGARRRLVGASRPTCADRRPRIVFLGDSLTAGYRTGEGSLCPVAHPASGCARAGIRTRSSTRESRVIPLRVGSVASTGRLPVTCEILVIELGANDGLRGLPVASLKQNLTEIITRAQARGISVVLTGMEAPPNFGAAYTSEFREVYRQLAREHDVTSCRSTSKASLEFRA